MRLEEDVEVVDVADNVVEVCVEEVTVAVFELIVSELVV